MRVISGTAKGRKLKFPKVTDKKKIRPLSDFAKEALFDLLRLRIEDAKFLDLFAGTGQIGIEALSRGAQSCFFVELEKKAVVVIKENLENTELLDKAEICQMDVMKAIAMLGKSRRGFDLIFIGAPYKLPLLEPTIVEIEKSCILNDNGIVIAEHNRKQVLSEEYGFLQLVRSEHYGDTQFSFYKRKK